MTAHDLVSGTAFDRHIADLTSHDGFQNWVTDGQQMARREGPAVFESIALRHDADGAAHHAAIEHMKARGQVSLAERDRLDHLLRARNFDLGEHERRQVQARVDLWWALALSVLNAALAVFVMLGFGPVWLTGLLALVILASAVAIEEFFVARDDKDPVREALFLVLAALALGGQFWLGAVRGMFITALMAGTDAGPVSHVLHVASPIIRLVLGILSGVSETVAGYKWYRARTLACSGDARMARTRDQRTRELVGLHGAIQAAQVEPDIRRRGREIGARQYLAIDARAAERHLTRAVTAAIIMLLVIVALLLIATNLFAATPTSSIVIALDLTRSTSDAAFRADLATVNALISGTPADRRVIVLGVTDAFGDPALLLDRQIPAAGYLGLESQAIREGILAEWSKTEQGLRPTHTQSDLIGAFTLLTYLGDLSPSTMTLVVLSDLRQCSPIVNFERVSRIDVARVIHQLQATQRIPRLTGTRVLLMGVDPAGKDAAYFADLRAFWLAFFHEAGAQVDLFSVGRPPMMLR